MTIHDINPQFSSFADFINIFFLLFIAAGDDFMPLAGSVSITLSGVDGQVQCFNVPIVDDDTLECEQDFEIEAVMISGDIVARIVDPNTTVVTILDDEGTYVHAAACIIVQLFLTVYKHIPDPPFEFSGTSESLHPIVTGCI